VSSEHNALLLRIAPLLFVLIWSTGWISARFGAPYADPLTFLSARYLIAGFCVSGVAWWSGAVWPNRRNAVHAIVSGVLLHAIYLGGVWWAIAQGLPTAVSGLLAAIQPILTALLAPTLLGERITAKQWLGIVLGFCGVALVLGPKLAGLSGDALSAVTGTVIVNVLAMVSVTLGTFYQKRFIQAGDLRTVTALQYVGAFCVTLPAAALLEPMHIEWNMQVILTMAWSVIAISMGAIGLLLMLIRRGAVSRAAALIYLVPPTVAIEAFLFFGETLSLGQIAGMVLSVCGVVLTRRS
jgi:drug/metabolite transporter (DMT)-like permease